MKGEIEAFDRKLFRVICLVAIIISINALIHNLIRPGAIAISVAHGVGVIIFMLFLSVSFFQKNLRTASLLLILYFFMVEMLFWFLVGGIESPIRSSSLAILVAIAVLSPPRYRLATILLFVVTVLMLIIIEVNAPQLFPEELRNSTASNIPYNLVLSIVGVSIIIFYLRHGYEKYVELLFESNSRLVEKQKEIENQNKLLIGQKEQVNLLKNTLETRVIERTRVLDKAIDQLHEYAYINSHLLRAPVARIKGLLKLLEYQHHEESGEVLEKLIYECNTLEEIVGRISLAVNQGAVGRKDLDNEEQITSTEILD